MTRLLRQRTPYPRDNDPEERMKIRQLTTAGENTAHITLSLVDLTAGETWEIGAENESAAVVLSGRADAAVDGAPLGVAGGRSSVFEAPGDTVYAPPGA